MLTKLKINLKIDNVILQKVDCTKYLGIFIDSNLSLENHIDYIYNKIIKFVGIFYKIRYKLNFEISKMIYYAFVHSHLIYGSLLINKSTHLADSDFIIRMLYKDMY